MEALSILYLWQVNKNETIMQRVRLRWLNQWKDFHKNKARQQKQKKNRDVKSGLNSNDFLRSLINYCQDIWSLSVNPYKRNAYSRSDKLLASSKYLHVFTCVSTFGTWVFLTALLCWKTSPQFNCFYLKCFCVRYKL